MNYLIKYQLNILKVKINIMLLNDINLIFLMAVKISFNYTPYKLSDGLCCENLADTLNDCLLAVQAGGQFRKKSLRIY